MTDLFLLRHGIAEDRASSKSDHERALTHDGKDKIHRISKAMKVLELSFDCILTSPFVRAKQTADIVARDLGAGGGAETLRELASGTDLRHLLTALTRYHSCKSLLLVGHEPDLSYLAGWILVGEKTVSVRFKKGGLCKLKVDSLTPARRGVLEWLLTPTQLLKIR